MMCRVYFFSFKIHPVFILPEFNKLFAIRIIFFFHILMLVNAILEVAFHLEITIEAFMSPHFFPHQIRA